MKAIVSEKMKHALAMKIPIEIEMSEGKNWLEAH